MKSSTKKLAAFSVAFCVGLAAAFGLLVLKEDTELRNVTKSFILDAPPQLTDVCRILTSVTGSDGESIVFEATTDGLERGGGTLLPLGPLRCSTRAKADIRLQFSGYSGPNKDLLQMIREPEPRRKGDDAAPFKEVDVRITGFVQKSAIFYEEGYWIVYPVDIEPISPFRRGFP